MIGFLFMLSAMEFTNTPMENEIAHPRGRYPVFGTEPTEAEIVALGTPPAAQDPRIPMHGYYPDSRPEWIAHHRAILRDAPTQPWKILFIGDSITQGWLRTEEWRKTFKPLGAFNMGIGGDRTAQVLWRIQHGELDHVKPKGIVLMIGTNNMWADCEKFGPEAIAEGTGAVLRAIHAKLPEAKVILLDVPPMLADPKHPVRDRIRAVNDGTKKFADGRTVIRVDVGQCFLGEGGSFDPSLSTDYVHPTGRGYSRIATPLLPVVEKTLAGNPD